MRTHLRFLPRCVPLCLPCRSNLADGQRGSGGSEQCFRGSCPRFHDCFLRFPPPLFFTISPPHLTAAVAVAGGSTNSWEAMYDMPKLGDEELAEIIACPFEVR